MLKSLLDYQTSTFKEDLVNEQFFQTSNQQLPFEENGRALGSLFAHNTFKDIQSYINEYAPLSQEIQNIGLQNRYSMPTGNEHQEIDRKFSTDYASSFDPTKETNFNALSYQMRGEKALEFGYFNQAVNDLGKAIELNPTNPVSYLHRGIANLGLRQYDHAIKDYHAYISQTPPVTYSFNTSDFIIGFAKGLPRGIAESGKGILLFLSDAIIHPIHTAQKMYEALTILSELARTEQWSSLCKAVAPELHKLITKWDTLPSLERGELSSFALGKYGCDIITPGALAKLISKGVKGAQELATAYKNLQIAEKILPLEAAAELGSGARVAEVLQAKTVSRAEELGFNSSEINQVTKVGKIESDIAKNASKISQNIKLTEHALQRAIERGVSKEAILDAIEAPLKIEEIKIDRLGRPSQRFIGKKAEVVLNPETQQIVSVNPTSTKKAEKLIDELSNGSS
ncbi:MAG: hypothetical protein L0207_04160 [Chlamydiae bacterium]|nr:hypothetical protein [Chlamydiota bacterium]